MTALATSKPSKPLADLLQDQSQLLDALFTGTGAVRHTIGLMQGLQTGGARHSLAERGLLAYRANGTALAERALAAAYPVLVQLIGDESFAPLARHFWRHAPPLRGDVAQWGAALADFLEAAPQLASEPFLGDVARVEWALHCAATAADSTVDLGSFALLASGDAQQATLTLSDGVLTLASAWPVVSIINAHLHAQPTLAQAAALLGAGSPEHALVWRQGLKPRLRPSSAAEHALVTALQAGLSLEASLAATGLVTADGGGFDFNDWLTQSVQSGLVTGAQLLNSTNDTEEEAS
ncbi:MAG: putative DNA-binding domain-containing protein [Polaromonas sp.]|nr:putative DNA-binding domain-containing protein [Polaromonas sp.]